MILTAVFAKDGGLITGQYKLFGLHLAATAIVAVFSFGGAYVLYRLTSLITPLRVEEGHEDEGLDLSQHDEAVMA